MLPDQVWNPGPLTYESGALPTALCCPAGTSESHLFSILDKWKKFMIFRCSKNLSTLGYHLSDIVLPLRSSDYQIQSSG